MTGSREPGLMNRREFLGSTASASWWPRVWPRQRALRSRSFWTGRPCSG